MGNCLQVKQRSFYVLKEDGYDIYCSQSEKKVEDFVENKFWICRGNKITNTHKYQIYQYIADGDDRYGFMFLKKTYEK